eukprot:817370-Prymnesium_polylepis.1
MLPASLFQSRRGAAAMRLLGISYRQAKLGSSLNGEILDYGKGWRLIKSGEKRDKVRYGKLQLWWHEDEASEPDNFNKDQIRIDLGRDPRTGENIYEYHARRAQKDTTRALLPVFRNSTRAAELQAENAKRKHPVKVGWRQFLKHKCPCVRKRKAAECACIKCTFVSHNLALVHAARPGWHRAKVQRIGGAPCVCHIHSPGLHSKRAQGLAARADALRALAEDWRAAAQEGGDAAVQAEAFIVEAAEAQAEADVAQAKERKAHTYDQMTKSVNTLTAALMPCGKVTYPDYSIIGAGEFRAYKKQCIFGNCEKAIWDPKAACSWGRVFGPICPTENTDDPFSWFTWEKRLRGVNEEGK